jgi:hypothetical protein
MATTPVSVNAQSFVDSVNQDSAQQNAVRQGAIDRVEADPLGYAAFNDSYLQMIRQQSDQQNQVRQASLDRVAADPAGYAAFNDSFLQGVRQQSDQQNTTRQASLDRVAADPAGYAAFNDSFLQMIRQQSDQQNMTRLGAIERNNADPNNTRIAPDFQGQHFDPATGGYVYDNPGTPLYYGMGAAQQLGSLGANSGGYQPPNAPAAMAAYGQPPPMQLPQQPTQQQAQQIPAGFTGQPLGNAGPTAPGNWGMDAGQALNGGRANSTVPTWLKPMFGGQF